MRVVVMVRSGPWAGQRTVQAAVRRAWAELGHSVAVVEFDPAPAPRGWLTRADGSARRLALAVPPDPPPDPVRSEADPDLMVGLIDALEFRDGGGPWLSQVAARAAQSVAPLIVLAQRVAVSERELRGLGVEAAYAVDLARPAGWAQVARTWSW
ncbi:MAG: hypothetical protein LBL55_11525 [Propionibacteriaceae bacterium]|nr:hypothetical protein [Propionibacteriaceae bacterium]